MRARLAALAALSAAILLPCGAQDFQSAENLYKKGYDWEQKFNQATRADPAKAPELLGRAIEYYGKAIERAATKNDDEYSIRASFAQARCYELMDPISEDPANNCYSAVAGKKESLGKYKEPKLGQLTWIVNRAEELLKREGVHMYLNRFARLCYDWRNGMATPKQLEEEKTKIWQLIQGKGPKGCYGLIQGLDVSEAGKEEQVIAFVADKLKEVIDEPNIALLIEKLGSKHHRAGAAVALREVMQQYNRARELDEQANQAEFDAGFIWEGRSDEKLPGGRSAKDLVDEMRKKLTDTTVGEMRDQAKKLRYHMPEGIESPAVFAALTKVIEDVGIDETARTEALMVLTSFDMLGEGLIATLLKALDDPNARVRAAAADVAGKVNTRRSEDKHMIADKLIQLIQYQPEIDTQLIELVTNVEQETHPDLAKLRSALADPKIQNDKAAKELARKALDDKKAELMRDVAWKRANGDLVRQQCAMSLGRLGLIKSLPCLIGYLTEEQKPNTQPWQVGGMKDSSKTVRQASYEAVLKIIEPLKEVRTVDLPFDPSAPRNAEMKEKELKAFDERAKAAPDEQKSALETAKAELEKKTPRDEDNKKWEEWWVATRAIEVLVQRWDNLMRKWNYYHPNDLYDADGFARKMEAKARFSPNPQKELERSQKVSADFEKLKGYYREDVVDMCTKAMDPQVAKDTIGHLFNFLGGKVTGRDEEYLAVQMFVADCLAAVAFGTKDEDTKKEIREIVHGFKEKPPEIKTGCAYALAFLDLSWIGQDETNAAERAVQDGDARVRRAVCFALGKIGNPRSAKHLPPRLMFAAEKETAVQIQAARAIGRIATQHKSVFQEADFVKEVTVPVYDEIDDPATRDQQKKDPRPEVREEVCYAVGQGAHPNALPYLIRARRDVDERVRYACAWANAQIGKNEPKSGDLLWEIYANKETKFSDREGAILGIGDVKDSGKVKILCEKLVGVEPEPFRNWEPHQRVRAAIAEALGLIGVRTTQVRDALMKALTDNAEEVRRGAFHALDRLCGANLSKIKRQIQTPNGPMETAFQGNLPMVEVQEFLKLFQAFMEGEGRELFKPGE
jgi:HEAT repeat protein